MKKSVIAQAKQQWPSAYAVHLHNCYFSHQQQALCLDSGVETSVAVEQHLRQRMAMSPGCLGVSDEL